MIGEGELLERVERAREVVAGLIEGEIRTRKELSRVLFQVNRLREAAALYQETGFPAAEYRVRLVLGRIEEELRAVGIEFEAPSA